MEENYWIVLCRLDVNPDGTKGDYVVASHQLFPTPQQAQDFLDAINPNRQPVIEKMRLVNRGPNE